MGATSVTGVGQGVLRTQKGPGNGRNFFVPQVNPHVVAAGTVELASGTATVVLPVSLADGAANYVVIATPDANIATQVYVTKNEDAGAFVSFDVDEVGAASTANVMWCVIKIGFGLDVARAD